MNPLSTPVLVKEGPQDHLLEQKHGFPPHVDMQNVTSCTSSPVHPHGLCQQHWAVHLLKHTANSDLTTLEKDLKSTSLHCSLQALLSHPHQILPLYYFLLLLSGMSSQVPGFATCFSLKQFIYLCGFRE